MVTNEILAQGIPFDEAIDFFRQKVRIPTEAWTDIREGMHSRAFVIAGGMRDDLLSDFQTAIMKGLQGGTTLAEFRKDFDEIVRRHGWSYKGGRGWRTSVIYNTNLRTAYQAGHFKQMTDPDVILARPYWRYSAVMDGRTRPGTTWCYPPTVPGGRPISRLMAGAADAPRSTIPAAKSSN
ncbi:MAG: phage head morphogenesis protein [Desulfobacteraceae bacterium]|nr:phage head morphogenesis protein [Desulfobacteraceae bacterium]